MSTTIDTYLGTHGPAALVLRDELVPVEGHDSPFFPPTYASGDNFAGGYNIDGEGADSVCLVDSVGAQANRIEPLFKKEPYASLVPQIIISAGDTSVSIFDAGHRAGDAIVRCSSLQEELAAAFKALQKGDATPLAKIAPTSLVFGVWDSRDTQAKAPRLLSSAIRAFGVQRLRRSAQYNPAAEYVAAGLVDEPADAAGKKAFAERGFSHVPATATHGGVIAKGGIRRDATLSLAALNLLHAGSDAEATIRLRRYVLGLGLVAFTANPTGYLRQGCNLVLDGDKSEPRRLLEVYPSGEKKPFKVSHEEALAFAGAAAKDFGVGPSRTVPFDKAKATAELAGDGDGKKAKPARKGKS
jgi:CRISPR-associated protein Csb1